ncbi:16S rRNA (cytosine(1402)-N(4))-methyltransferase RsmH [Klebsiella pneumoniae]|uniref:Ribosomal RNA small subunit methyltransferase H n=3 Tax=Enterobacteriaceae TaxID=543 RepID=A0A1J0QYY8_KLEPN|nr:MULTISPECIES: 16S rRNA (cytosine(1402)-N(4))-methyltransferase RsmH [Enterobacterales]AHE47403.1 Ribosomal RNA small subunit methyltransferase H [Klebsiella pneumoniae subsp. pneumoniae Kp13]APD70476.1 16S rRNA (cytosine(1402)-N(4))-methyltransferase [Klebsiella pneumoniae]APD70840.1 Ribosomal RNA small subunit methyltransferase H [Klebsiella pneumoniae]ASC14749.1 16S rRNA (cytosine(1402)-N(4))-methyltransferase [Klebsiella pneumoniae]KJL69880.1 16S rRNA methyltransferase [Enterobacter horm
MEFHHLPVLLHECMDGLNIRPDGTYLDCTLGGAGHSSEIFLRLHGGRLIGIDRDADAIEAAGARMAALNGDAEFTAIRGNFHDAPALLSGIGVRRVDGILADLGVSSHQLDVRERGFSYHDDAPLDMRMDASQPLSAREIVNTWSEDEINRVLRDYGEENWSRQIARVICDRRQKRMIETTGDLVSIIDAAIPKKFRSKDGSHPARRTFQALRIAVNDELDPLDKAIEDLVNLLNPAGRICIITFHSLEDRIVKNTFRRLNNPCTCPKEFPVCMCGKKPVIELISRKPITASAQELSENPRARSASLRIAEKI